MSNANLFELATRKKLRIEFKGKLTAEDLWDTSLEELDIIYAGLKTKEDNSVKHSLSATDSKKSKESEELQLKISLIEYIYNVKKEESQKAIEAGIKKAEKQKLLAVLAAKKDDALQQKTAEEIEAMINNL